MLRTDSGKARIKALATTLAVLGIVYIAAKTLPVYVHNYELKDYIHQLAIQATAAQRPTLEAVRDSIVAKAQDLNLPVKNENVRVVFNSGRIVIDIDYTAPVDLAVYTLNLHFHPSADNRALL